MYEVFKQVRKRMHPPSWASWQTFILLSLFSAVLAAVTSTRTAQGVIANFGWFFLIVGVWWFTYDEGVKKTLTIAKLFVGPWITGALVCVWLFGSWQGRPTDASFIAWPPISVAIWSVPRFIKSDPVTKSPIPTTPTPTGRQEIILILLINLIFSCWFQFSFLVNDWITQYPTLLNDDFRRSGFVVRFPPNVGTTADNAQGIEFLNQAERELKSRLEGRPWSEVERWLLDLNQQLPDLVADVRKQLSQAESNFWNLQGQVLNDRGNAYDLQLEAQWRGPTSTARGYTVTKVCKVTQTQRSGPPARFEFTSPAPPAESGPRRRLVGTVNCEAPSKPQPGETPFIKSPT